MPGSVAIVFAVIVLIVVVSIVVVFVVVFVFVVSVQFCFSIVNFSILFLFTKFLHKFGMVEFVDRLLVFLLF